MAQMTLSVCELGLKQSEGMLRNLDVFQESEKTQCEIPIGQGKQNDSHTAQEASQDLDAR